MKKRSRGIAVGNGVTQEFSLTLRSPQGLSVRAGPELSPVASRERVARRVRAAETPLDANALIQDVVAKIQAQGNAEVERMREAVRKAIAVLEAIVT